MKKHTYLIAAGLLLGALSPLQTRAQSQNTWLNTSGNFLWDGTSANWSSPAIWADGSDAIFGATGAGNVTLNADSGSVVVDSLTFNAPGYNLFGNGNFLVLTNASVPPINLNFNVNTNVTIAAFIQGTNGLAVNGTGTLYLSSGSGNGYTGGTYVHGGTVVLDCQGVTGTSIYAVDAIQAIDTGAVVQIGTQNDGLNTATSNVRPPDGQVRRGNGTGGRLNLTGGTFDNNGDNNGILYPPPEGSGIIVNSSQYARAVMKLTGGSGTYIFTGSINDGGPTINYTYTGNSGIGYQQNIDMNGGGPYTLELGGSNSFTGFIRINSSINGNKVVMLPGGTLGYPAPINCPARQILMNSGTIDLNGTSQNVGYVYTGNDVNSIITNSAFGTLSTLTVCYNCTNGVAYNGAATPRGIRCGLLDDPTTGGTLALTKNGIAIQPIGDYAADNDTAMPNNYHGDTTVNNGILEACSVKAISPNSNYRLNSPGVLQLDFPDTVTIGQLYLNGVRQPAGIYGSGQTSLITGSGSLQVLPPNVWTDAGGNGFWDFNSANWTTPATWSQGSDAIFNATGAGLVLLENNIEVHNMTFNASGYTILGDLGSILTLIDSNATITASAGTSNALQVSINGTNGVTFAGTGTTILQGDPTHSYGNNYTGQTYIHSGTVILGGTVGIDGNASSTIGSIEALDTGALLQMAFLSPVPGGPVTDLPAGQFPYNRSGATLIMTGGTLDLNGWRRNGPGGPMRCPDGTGLIVNSSPWLQSAMVIYGDGQNHTFSGHINDGGPQGPNLSPAPFSDKAYQMGILDLHYGTGGYELTLSGSNSFSGSVRCGNGSIKLSGAGTLGLPSALPGGWTGPLRVYGPNHIDLNGTSQTVGQMNTTIANGPGQIYNTAVGTVSTLNFGFGPNTNTSAIGFVDNPGTGGILAMNMVGTGEQGLNGTNTYSGDTRVSLSGGLLALATTTAVSPNSAFRLSTSGGLLGLQYTGDAPVRQLWINGVQQPNGTYGAIGNSLGAIGVAGIDPASTGTITVTGYAPVVLNTTQSGGNLNFTWSGIYKLQSNTNLVGGTWTDVPGTSPVIIPLDKTKKSLFYRLSTY